jgi:hypothetical protein
MRGIITAPIALVMLPIRIGRGIAHMRLSTVLAIGTGAAAAYTASRRLLQRDDAPDELPEPLRPAATAAQRRLRGWRGDLTAAITDAREEEATAERELYQDYLRRVGRSLEDPASE